MSINNWFKSAVSKFMTPASAERIAEKSKTIDTYKKYASLPKNLKTLKRYNLLKKQGGVCGICNEVIDYKKAIVDHNHRTDNIRGLLCNGCNVVVGQYENKDKTFYINAKHIQNAAKDWVVNDGLLEAELKELQEMAQQIRIIIEKQAIKFNEFYTKNKDLVDRFVINKIPLADWSCGCSLYVTKYYKNNSYSHKIRGDIVFYIAPKVLFGKYPSGKDYASTRTYKRENVSVVIHKEK